MADTLLQKTLRQISESLPDGGEQGLPTEQPLIAQAVANDAAAIDPMLAAYFKKIGLDPAMAATLSPDDMKRMAYSAREDAYNTAMQADLRRSGKLQSIGTTYAEANPQDYYNTFGTIPLQSLGKSRYGITDAGALDTKEGAEGIKYLTPDQTATYTLYSPRTGKTLGSGTGAEGLISLAQMAQNQTATKDRKADWQLIKTPAEGGDPEVVASNLFNTDLSTLGKIVAVGLPIATAFIPGLNILGSNLLGSVVLGAGAGGLSAAMQDQNVLKGALIGGASAGLMKGQILPGGKSIESVVGGALNKVPVVGDTLRGIGNILDLPAAAQRAAAQKASTDIVVNAATKAVPKILSGGIGSLANAALAPSTVGPEPRRPDYGDKVEPDTGEAPIVVTGDRLNRAVNIIANGGTFGDLMNAGFTIDEVDAARAQYNADREPGTTVIGEKLPPVPVPSFTPGPVDNVALPEDEIVVTRKNEKPVTGVDAIINSVAPSLNAPTMDVPAETPSKKMGVADYIRLGLLVPGAISGIGGLLGGGDNTTLPVTGGGIAGFTPMNRSFTGGGIGGGAGGTFDPFTYGQALPGAQTAEYEFFQPSRITAADPTAAYNSALAKFNTYQNDLANQVASGELTPDDAQVMAQNYAINAGYQTTPAMAAPEAVPAYKDGGEVEDDMVRHLVEWHKGGGHAGPGKVKGIGSGQEDLIPAWLSDGEYVWSAQDVADLGDGSTDEGVRRLDKMRHMVRRRAGRKDVKKIAKPQRGIDTMLKAVGGSV